jgi:hypothetical protein
VKRNAKPRLIGLRQCGQYSSGQKQQNRQVNISIKINKKEAKTMFSHFQNYIVPTLTVHKRFLCSSIRIVSKDNLLAAAYKPEIVEKNKYEKWEKKGIFKADVPSDKPPFSMVLPPPNITGNLHLGIYFHYCLFTI